MNRLKIAICIKYYLQSISNHKVNTNIYIFTFSKLKSCVRIYKRVCGMQKLKEKWINVQKSKLTIHNSDQICHAEFWTFIHQNIHAPKWKEDHIFTTKKQISDHLIHLRNSNSIYSIIFHAVFTFGKSIRRRLMYKSYSEMKPLDTLSWIEI